MEARDSFYFPKNTKNPNPSPVEKSSDFVVVVQLTENRNGKYSTAYVLDTKTTPDMRKAAALQAQKKLADCMQTWGVSLLDTSVPERMKYDFLAEVASHLMQVLNDPEHITGYRRSGCRCRVSLPDGW